MGLGSATVRNRLSLYNYAEAKLMVIKKMSRRLVSTVT